MVAAWIGNGSAMPARERAATSGAGRPRSAKVGAADAGAPAGTPVGRVERRDGTGNLTVDTVACGPQAGRVNEVFQR